MASDPLQCRGPVFFYKQFHVLLHAQDKGRPLPKFGEWDVNNPASAEGFTVIFNKARDEKKTSGSAANMVTPRRSDPVFKTENYPQYPRKRMWFCCG